MAPVGGVASQEVVTSVRQNREVCTTLARRMRENLAAILEDRLGRLASETVGYRWKQPEKRRRIGEMAAASCD